MPADLMTPGPVLQYADRLLHVPHPHQRPCGICRHAYESTQDRVWRQEAARFEQGLTLPCLHTWEPIAQPEGDTEYRCKRCGSWWAHLVDTALQDPY